MNEAPSPVGGRRLPLPRRSREGREAASSAATALAPVVPLVPPPVARRRPSEEAQSATLIEFSSSGSTMNAPAPPAPRLAAGGTTELCHLTVSGPERRADLAIPATATLGELLPIVVKHTAGDGAAEEAWVLQRLGGPPLDFGGTAESLDLREGEVLYLNPESAPLPEFDFDDVSVGVAYSVAARPDQWRPSFSRVLMMGSAAVVAGAFAVGLAGVRPASTQVLCYGLAALLLAVGAVLDSRMSEDKSLATVAGLGACVFAALLGFAARHGSSGLFTIDRRALMIAGFAVPRPWPAGRLPRAAVGGGLRRGDRDGAVRGGRRRARERLPDASP